MAQVLTSKGVYILLDELHSPVTDIIDHKHVGDEIFQFSLRVLVEPFMIWFVKEIAI